MSTEDFFVDGLDRLLVKLEQLDQAAGVKVLRGAARDAMKPVEAQMRSLAHVGTEATANSKNYEGGDLRDSIAIRARTGSKRQRDRVITISVGPLKKSHKGRKLKNVKNKALAQEYGNRNFKADPFIRRSLDMHKGMILRELKSSFARRFDKIFSGK